MKKKSLKLRWPSFFGQRLHASDSSGSGNMPELISPESAWEKAESGTEEILRWADDGGRMLDLGSGTTKSIIDAAREGRNKR